MKFLVPVLLLSVLALSSEACHCNTEEKAPVCGSDGITYNNACVFGCNGGAPVPPATILYRSACADDKPCDCPKYLEPVCGSDGQTWPNACFLECGKKYADPTDESRKDLKVVTTGACGNPCDCTGKDTEALMCGSDNVTYKNQCVLDCVIAAPYGKFLKVTAKQSGAC